MTHNHQNGGCRVKQRREGRHKKEEEKHAPSNTQPGSLTMSDKLKAVLMAQYALGPDESSHIMSQVEDQEN